MADERLAGDPARDERLREAAARLAGELDEAGLFAAAALAAMARDAVVRAEDVKGAPPPHFVRSPKLRPHVLGCPPGTLRRSPPANSGEDIPNDIELEFEVDEHGRVWMIREGDCHIIGRKEPVCAEMRRFLGEAEGEIQA